MATVDSDIYDRIHAQLPDAALYAVKLPDGFPVTAPGLVITRQPGMEAVADIAGVLLLRRAKYQVSIYDQSLAAARATREALIAALHGYQGGTIKDCQYDDDAEEIDIDGRCHIPVDFIVTF